MTDEFFAWSTDSRGPYATLLRIENVEDDFELKRGLSLTERFPPDAAFRMDPAYPRDVALADAMSSRSGDGLMIVSPALADVIRSMSPPDTEFLPVTLYDHKDQVASDEYVIVNPYRVVDCIDQEASTIAWNPIDPELIADVTDLSLDASRIDPEVPLFRPRYLPTRILVRGDLADAIEGAGLSGLYLEDLDEVGT